MSRSDSPQVATIWLCAGSGYLEAPSDLLRGPHCPAAPETPLWHPRWWIDEVLPPAWTRSDLPGRLFQPCVVSPARTGPELLREPGGQGSGAAAAVPGFGGAERRWARPRTRRPCAPRRLSAAGAAGRGLQLRAMLGAAPPLGGVTSLRPAPGSTHPHGGTAAREQALLCPLTGTGVGGSALPTSTPAFQMKAWVSEEPPRPPLSRPSCCSVRPLSSRVAFWESGCALRGHT